MKTAKILNNIVFIHFIKVALLPSLLLFVVKLVSMFGLAILYNLNYYIENNTVVFSDIEAFLRINDYSSAFAFLTVFSFTLWLVFKGMYLHKTHIPPKLSAWLLKNDLSYLVSSSLDLYIRIFVWLAFTWLCVLLIAFHYVIGFSGLWLLLVSFILSILVTIFAVIDIERDYKIYALNKFNNKLLQI